MQLAAESAEFGRKHLGRAAALGEIPAETLNVNGGGIALGHPVGATGVSMHVLAAMQLTGTAGDIQVPNAQVGAVFNMGGAAVANYVSILETVKT